jgi:hypothetical protein
MARWPGRGPCADGALGNCHGLPDFAGRIQGREEFLAGFHDFCQNAAIQQYQEHDRQVDVAGDTAVVTFRYEMVYQRSA